MNNTAWQRARREAKLPYVRVHDLRHTFATRRRAAGVSEDRAALILRAASAPGQSVVRLQPDPPRSRRLRAQRGHAPAHPREHPQASGCSGLPQEIDRRYIFLLNVGRSNRISPKKMALRPRSKSQHISSRRQLGYEDLTLRCLAC
jgi:hypothetical protein